MLVPLHTLREGVIWFRISFMIELSGNSISPRGDRFKSSSSSAMPAVCSRCSQPTPAHQPSLRLAPGHPILQVRKHWTKIRSRLDVLRWKCGHCWTLAWGAPFRQNLYPDRSLQSLCAYIPYTSSLEPLLNLSQAAERQSIHWGMAFTASTRGLERRVCKNKHSLGLAENCTRPVGTGVLFFAALELKFMQCEPSQVKCMTMQALSFCWCIIQEWFHVR